METTNQEEEFANLDTTWIFYQAFISMVLIISFGPLIWDHALEKKNYGSLLNFFIIIP